MSIISFRPKDRGSALSTIVQTFNMPHSAMLYKSMSKPTFDAITASSTQPAIVFVSSRGQCLSVALDLITQSGTEMDINGFLGTTPDQLEPYLGRLRDRTLVDPLLHGIGIYHDSLLPSDASLVLELFASAVIRVLVVPREACWTLPVRASTVVVMSTQYVHFRPGEPFRGGDRQIRNYSMQELFKMQSFAVQPIPSSLSASPPPNGKFVLLCQAEHRDSFVRFLADGLPLESTLHKTPVLRNAVQAEMRRGNVVSRQDGVDLISHTLLARRVRSNPTYYDVELALDENGNEVWDGVKDRLSRIVDECMQGEQEKLEEERGRRNGEEKVGSKVLEVTKENTIRHVPGSAPAVVEGGR